MEQIPNVTEETEEKKIQIPNVAEETKEKIKRSSAYSLPHNPTGAGYKPQDIKNALFKPIVDGQNSVLKEIDNLITELNDALNTQLAATISLGVYKSGTEGGISWQLATANGGILASGTIPIEQEVKASNNLISAKAVDDKCKELGSNIEASVDQDYKLTVALKSQSGVLLSESTIDLPIESMIIGASYKDGVLSLQLKNNDDGSIGNTIDVNISDLISGLVNDEDFVQFEQSLVKYVNEQLASNKITVEQEVNNSTNPISSKAVKEVTDKKQDTITYDDTITDTRAEISVSANTFYILKNPLEDLRLQFGDEFFALRFTVGTSFQYSFLYGASGVSPKFIGKTPDFQEGETWELNIMDGIVASGKVVSKNEPFN